MNIKIFFKWNEFIHTERLYVFTLTYQIKWSVIASANVPLVYAHEYLKGTATHLTLPIDYTQNALGNKDDNWLLHHTGSSNGVL